MRLVRYARVGQPRVGVLTDSHVVDLAPDGMEVFLADENAVAAARAVASGGDPSPTSTGGRFAPDDVTLLAPVARPGKILGVALNFVSHADEAEREMPTYPTLFMKPRTTIADPGSAIPIPRVTHRIDYEGELVIVIGRHGRYVPEARALEYVAGYTVGNDVSARDYQFRTKEITQGKAFDGFLPLGPWLTTADELPEVGGERLTTHVNGDLRQDALLSEMVFSVAHLVSYASDIMTLEPGDLILAGTPGGIGAALNPRRWLRAGDTVQIEIGRLGVLTSPVATEDDAGVGLGLPNPTAGAGSK
jgi:2-keto-4-pentenoate hydratase/2-oxohepta-3-ene-1,7-dioic acid hydratase in catechol pathway